jgi:VWFA-related protein
MHRVKRAALLALLLLLLSGTVASAKGDAALPPRYQKWLDEVAVLMSPEERAAFLALHEDARRDAFIEAFWNARDPDPAHPDHSFKKAYYERREEAVHRYRSLKSDAAKIYVINGDPGDIYRMDCGLAFWPLEIWYYLTTPRMARRHTLLFWRPAAGPELTLWHPEDGIDVLMAFPVLDKDTRPPLGSRDASGEAWQFFVKYVHRFCRSDEDEDRLLSAVSELQTTGRTAETMVQAAPVADPEWLSTFAAGSTDAPPEIAREPLSPNELRWLDDVAVLITPEERRTYLSLPHAYQRRGFIEAFWKQRDTTPKTVDNEVRGIFEARVETAHERWGAITVDQARVYLVNGDPAKVFKSDCDQNLWPLEVWHYAYSDRSRRPFALLFYQPGLMGPFKLWHADEGYAVLQRRPTGDAMSVTDPRPGFGLNGEFAAFYKNVRGWCPAEADDIVNPMRMLEQVDRTLVDVVEQGPPTDPEWLETYRAFSTEVAGSTAPLEAEVDIDYPGRHQSRTVVRGSLRVPHDPKDTNPAHAFSLVGEVLRDEVLHESFRYYYQLVSPGSDGKYPLVFERYLRAGEYRLVLKLEDAQTGRAVRIERQLSVPEPPPEAPQSDASSAPPPQPGAEGFRLLPPASDIVSGVVRIDAEVGDPRIRAVAFSLDDKPILTKHRPPWSVELRLGDLPRSMRVRAVALDELGVTIAADEIELNAAPHRFAVRLVEPREGEPKEPMRVRAVVQVPPDAAIDRLELFLDDQPVATLYQEPWEAVISTLPTPTPTFLRALGHLTNGATAEDVVLLGSGETQRSAIDVDTVEVYTAAIGGDGRPVLDLKEDDFVVREDGRPQTLRRFEKVNNLPLQVGLLVDTSASMADMLPKVQDAALRFFREQLAPGDRAAVVTFSEEPRLAAPFTRDIERLGAALVGLQAARGTALWDSLVYSLHYFQGTPGRRALLVFSDGDDRGSHYTFDKALAYAEHSGVSVYAVSFGGAATTLLDPGRRHLADLAVATGGRSFVLGSTDELRQTYDTIGEDLRSQYLLVYQSDGQGTGFRAVDVQIKRAGVTARTMRGYLP